MAKEKLKFDVHLPNLLTEAVNNDKTANLKIPARIAMQVLLELAEFAIKKNDAELHIFMLRLGLYEVSASERVKLIKAYQRRVDRLKKAEII